MIKNDLLIKIVDFHQPFEIKRKRAGTIKSLIAQRAKLNHPLFKSTQSRCNKNHFPTDCIFDNNSKQHFCSYLQIAAGKYNRNRGESVERQLKIYNNNYKAFPCRSLLVKPHVVKNTGIRLNLFQKEMDRSDERYNTLMAKTLQLKFTEESMGKTKTIHCTTERKREHQRVVSASAKMVLCRQSSVELEPWKMLQEIQDNQRF